MLAVAHTKGKDPKEDKRQLDKERAAAAAAKQQLGIACAPTLPAQTPVHIRLTLLCMHPAVAIVRATMVLVLGNPW